MADFEPEGGRRQLCKIYGSMNKRSFQAAVFSLQAARRMAAGRAGSPRSCRSHPQPADGMRQDAKAFRALLLRPMARQRRVLEKIHGSEAIGYSASTRFAAATGKGLGVFGFSIFENADPAVRAAAFERAALAVARLDATLDRHPLLPAWQHWVRLEALLSLSPENFLCKIWALK